MAIRLSGLASGLDTEELVKNLTSGYQEKKDQVWKDQKSLEYKQDAWKDLNKDIYGFFSDTLSKSRMEATYMTNELKLSNDKVASVSGGKQTQQQTLEVQQLASPTYITGGEVNVADAAGLHGVITISTGAGTQEVAISAGMTMNDIAQKLSTAGITANFDGNNNRFFLSSAGSGAASNFELGGNSSLLSALGLGSSASKQVGTNAKIKLNGAEFESTTNDFTINGMKIQAGEVGTTTLSMASQDRVYDTVKNFFDKYNELIIKMNTSYNTSAKGYKPLTDDERYALSDKVADEWDKQVKDAALYKDSSLNKVLNGMKNTLLGYRNGDMTLSSLGIKQGSYFETDVNNRGTYTIDEDKLKAMIAEDPQKVVDFMSGLGNALYDTLNKQMKSTSMNSAYTLYNDKQMKKDISAYEKKIQDWDDKIAKMENKYFKQFAQMEKALSTLQNQTSSLSSLFSF